MRRPAVCPHPGCPHLVTNGDCPSGHARAKRQAQQQRTDSQRPTARRRGYDTDHERLFRQPVLRRDPVCVQCHQAPSVHADHWPRTRTELVTAGANPNDPRHGRGLCASCHATHTATHDGGFGNPTRPHHAQ